VPNLTTKNLQHLGGFYFKIGKHENPNRGTAKLNHGKLVVNFFNDPFKWSEQDSK
jgi:hypothetical protein